MNATEMKWFVLLLLVVVGCGQTTLSPELQTVVETLPIPPTATQIRYHQPRTTDYTPIITFMSPDSIPNLMTFYETELTQQGWSEPSSNAHSQTFRTVERIDRGMEYGKRLEVEYTHQGDQVYVELFYSGYQGIE